MTRGPTQLVFDTRAAWRSAAARIAAKGWRKLLVIGTRRMVDAAQADCVLVDTTGLVLGRGAVLKALKIEAVRPHALVMIEQGEELAPIARAHRHLEPLRIPPSPAARRKSERVRRRPHGISAVARCSGRRNPLR